MKNIQLIFRSLLISVAIGLIVNNHYGEKTQRNPTQLRFEKWLAALEAPGSTPNGLTLKATIRNNLMERTLVLSSTDNDNNDSEQKLLRLLSLAREANLFSLQAASSDPAEGRVTLELTDKDQSFATTLSEASIASNSSAQVMLKLFDLYGKPAKAIASAH